jgi:glutamine phosphoribosylpyrophosphate amidotransferase
LGRLELEDAQGNTYTVDIDIPETPCMQKHVIDAVIRLNNITTVIDGNVKIAKEILKQLEDQGRIVSGDYKATEDFETLHHILCVSFWKNFEREMQAQHPPKVKEPKEEVKTEPAKVIPLRNPHGHTLH